MKVKFLYYLNLVGLSAILNAMIEIISRKSMGSFLSYALNRPFIFLLNTYVVLMPILLVFYVKRKAFVLFLISFFWLLLGCINGILLMFRTTPFTFTDVRLVKYALNIVHYYLSWIQILAAVLLVLMVVLAAAYLWKWMPAGQILFSPVMAVCCTVITGVLFGGIDFLCQSLGYVEERYGNIGKAYEEYGFAYCFANTVFNTGISKPEDYSEQMIQLIEQTELVPEMTFELDETNKPNVIMVQLESFFDPARWDGYERKENMVPYFSYLREHYAHGFLSVPSVGAGTANTEFECITGMNLDFFGAGEYPYKTVLQKTTCESLAYNMKTLGYGTHAIHNNEATFYDRHIVFSQLGFDTFTPIEYMYGVERNQTGWCKDSILTGEILKVMESTPQPDFIYTISVQGHGAYPDFDYYCEQLREMDQFINNLVGRLKERGEPVVVVFYGDHLPGFEWSEEEMDNRSLYQTEYVVWSNLKLPVIKKDLEAYQLGAYILDLLDLHEGSMVRLHQNFFRTRQITLEKYLEDMELLEYDILYGQRQIYAGEQRYEPTFLRLGTVPITISRIDYRNGNILISGENFNGYSTICINGKAVETVLISRQFLVGKQLPKKEEQDQVITVEQIGRDKIPLGTAFYRNE